MIYTIFLQVDLREHRHQACVRRGQVQVGQDEDFLPGRPGGLHGETAIREAARLRGHDPETRQDVALPKALPPEAQSSPHSPGNDTFK